MLLQIFKTLPGTVGAQMEETGRAAPPFGFRPDSVRRRHAEDVRSEDRLCSRRRSKRKRRWGCTRSSPILRRERFPLALISPASDKTISSTLGELPRPAVALLMNPADAAPRGLKDDDPIKVFNELGEVQCAVKIEATIREGTVSLPKGIVAQEHVEPVDQQRARARLADRSRRRRVLQRRPRGGRAAGISRVSPQRRNGATQSFLRKTNVASWRLGGGSRKDPSSSYTTATLSIARLKAAVRRSPILGSARSASRMS